MFDGQVMSGPATVHVAGGTVTRVDTGPGGGPGPAGREIIDLGPESCLLPGLIDCHVHLAFDASEDPVAALRASGDAQLLATMRAAARTAVRAGITTVRDLGDRGYLALTLAGEVAADPVRGPEILAAGPPVTTPGGHCFFLGGAAEGPDALRAAVRDRHARGCAVVKIMLSGGTMTPGTTEPHKSQFSRADARTVVAEAHRLGLPVAAHAHGVTAIRDAISAGVDSIEHVSFMDRDPGEASPADIDAVVASGVFASLTLGVDRSAGTFDLDPDFARRVGFIVNAYRELARRGAKVVLGTDAGIGPFKRHDVLPLAVAQLGALGVPAVDALAAATSRAAAACGLDGRKGRIRPGADADFLAVTGDPGRDLAALRNVRAVFRAGIRVR